MKILITGGVGFIGRHLAKRLLKEGYDVVIIDNLSRWDKDEIKDIIDKVEFIEGDIRDTELIDKLVSNCDCVYHLAAISQVMQSIKDPEECFDYNVNGTENIAKACVKHYKKLIFASSREVYGNAKYIPVDLKHPLNIENPYGASKISAEKIIRAFGETSNLNYNIIRMSNVIGKGDKGRAIPIFIEKARNGEKISIYGKEKVIDFLFIDDAIDALIKSKDLDENIILNLGSGVATRLKDVANAIADTLNSKSIIELIENREGEVNNFCADISLTTEKLNWKPQFSLQESIFKIIK